MKTPQSARGISWIGWILAGLIIALMGAGLALQVVTNAPLLGGPFLLHFSEVTGLSGFALIGALIVARNPRHPIGWTWLLIAFSFGIDHFAWGYAYYGTITRTGSLPGAQAAVTWLYWMGRGTFGMLGLTVLLLLFPTGRPLSRVWGLVAWVAAVRVALAIPFSGLAPNPRGAFAFPTNLLNGNEVLQSLLLPYKSMLDMAGILCFGLAAFSLFRRLVQSSGIERQQIKWFIAAAGFLIPAFLLIALGSPQQTSGYSPIMLAGAFLGVLTTLSMAAASAIAIFRYRLWDIDILIRRTMVYGLLSSVLALIYFSSVLLFQQILQLMTGQGSAAAVVISTLISAALFTPLRRRIQDFIDQRFYRRKFNVERITAELSARLREEHNLEQLSEQVVRLIEEALQPESMSLWLRQSEDKKPDSWG